MSRANVFQARQPQQQFGWEASSEYHEHLTRMARTPTLLPEPSHYPNVHMIFKHKEAYEQEDSDAYQEQQRPSPINQKAEKKVQVTDQQEVIEEDRNGNLVKVIKEDVNYEADSFIKKQHKGFELRKWKTFNLH